MEKNLENRMEQDPRGAEAARETIDRVKGRERKPTEPDTALAERLAVAKALTPAEADRHCLDCWTRGRDAAIRAIEGAA
jgi:hypothetical protein